jgi:hypothetical protein
MKLRIGLLAAAMLALAAGVAFATIPGNGGVIHGCYKSANGDLRVIDSSVATCKSSETALDWSQTGAPGPAGPQGPAGAQGPAGPQGPPGPSFGDGTYRSAVTMNGCVDNEVATRTVTLTTPSRIFADGQGYFSPGSTGASGLDLFVELRDAADATTLAVSGTTRLAQNNVNGEGFAAIANVLLAGTARFPDGAPAYTAAPGTYVLRLVAAPANLCAAHSALSSIALSYTLLGTTP